MVAASARMNRAYRSPQREAQARRTRQGVLRAASVLFAERGYAGTTMKSVAARANVSVPTVEALFGTKPRLLKAAIDVAIAGNDEREPMLEREWASAARSATDVEQFLSIAAAVLGPAQARSAGLVLSVFDGAGSDPELATMAAQLTSQRASTAAWFVARITAISGRRDDISDEEAVDTVFTLMEPAVFHRLTSWRGWTLEQYQRWFVRSVVHLLVPDTAHERPKPGPEERTSS